jgi:hypothetical protein
MVDCSKVYDNPGLCGDFVNVGGTTYDSDIDRARNTALGTDCQTFSNALHLAAESGSSATVDLLLATGADVNNQDPVSTFPPPLTRPRTASITGVRGGKATLRGSSGVAGRVDCASFRGEERPHRDREEAAGRRGGRGHAVRGALSLLPSAVSRQGQVARGSPHWTGAVGCRTR